MFSTIFINYVLIFCLFTSVFSSSVTFPYGGDGPNNWALILGTSKYWYNYRHISNPLSFYKTVKRLGIPDNQIVLMLGEDIACNARNPNPGTIFNDKYRPMNMYGGLPEVDYRGDEVSVDNVLRLLLDQYDPYTPRSKRMMTNADSSIFIYITGHGGDGFIKFLDWELMTPSEFGKGVDATLTSRRAHQIMFVADTCQAASLSSEMTAPGILSISSSSVGESSYSHHGDTSLATQVIDRFTYHSLNFFQNNLKSLSNSRNENNKIGPTIGNWVNFLNFSKLLSTVTVRSDLFNSKMRKHNSVDWHNTPIVDFLASSTANVNLPSQKEIRITIRSPSQKNTFIKLYRKQYDKYASRLHVGWKFLGGFASMPEFIGDLDSVLLSSSTHCSLSSTSAMYRTRVLAGVLNPIQPEKLASRGCYMHHIRPEVVRRRLALDFVELDYTLLASHFKNSWSLPTGNNFDEIDPLTYLLTKEEVLDQQFYGDSINFDAFVIEGIRSFIDRIRNYSLKGLGLFMSGLSLLGSNTSMAVHEKFTGSDHAGWLVLSWLVGGSVVSVIGQIVNIIVVRRNKDKQLKLKCMSNSLSNASEKDQ